VLIVSNDLLREYICVISKWTQKIDNYSNPFKTFTESVNCYYIP
jgi:hypothetical protein